MPAVSELSSSSPEFSWNILNFLNFSLPKIEKSPGKTESLIDVHVMLSRHRSALNPFFAASVNLMY